MRLNLRLSLTSPLRTPAICWALATCIVAPLLLTGCQANESDASTSGPAPAVPVKAVRAVREDFPVRAHAIGWVQAYSTVTIRPQVDGLVESVHFDEGADVKKGDLLYSIDARPFQTALALAEANLAQVKIQSDRMNREAQRIQKLFDKGQAADRELDQYLTDARAKAAEVNARQADVDRARLDLEYCSIKSPIDGRAGHYLVNPGNTVKKNETDLVVINELTPIYVQFSLPESSLSKLRSASTRDAKVTMQLQGASDTETGQLSFVDNTVDRDTGMVKLKATFANDDKRLWPGAYGDVEMLVDQIENAVVVPAEAVQDGQSQPFVYVVKADSTVEPRNVQKGLTEGGRTVIVSGLSGDETVVTDGQLRLTAGAKVSIYNESTTTAPSTDGAGE